MPTNCERSHKSVLQDFYQVAFRKKIHQSTEELQADLGEWIARYNEWRPHRGRYCYGKKPMQTWQDSTHLAQEEILNRTLQTASQNGKKP